MNDILADNTIGHQLDLQHYSNGVVRRIIALLNRAHADLVNALRDVMDRLPPESFTVERLDRLLKSVRELNALAYDRVHPPSANKVFVPRAAPASRYSIDLSN